MIEPALTLSADDGIPTVRVIVNPRYVLYHYLVAQGELPIRERYPAIAGAAARATRARHLRGVHGIWDTWEVPLAGGETMDAAIAGLRSAMTDTVNELSAALREAEPAFLADVWPQRREAVEQALTTIRAILAPAFPAMARRQAEQLDLVWPTTIDAYLVTDCYDWQGGYSHPLTIDVTTHTGLTLVETFLHEATHVADVHSNELGRHTLGTRLQYALTAAGTSPATAWNVWHAIIFAASAAQVRACVDANYTDYATAHELYSWFGAPKLPTLWSAFTRGVLGTEELLRAVTEDVRSSG